MGLKEKNFFDKLYYKYLGKSKVFHHIVLGCWCIIVAATCSIPAQETMIGSQSDYPLASWLPGAIAFGVAFATSACTGQFRTYMEQNTKNQIGSVIELLQYHPIDKRAIQKEKVKYQLQFLVRLSLICLLVQLLGAYMSLGKVEWVNVIYIFIVVFLVPAVLEILGSWIKLEVLYGKKMFDSIAKQVGE